MDYYGMQSLALTGVSKMLNNNGSSITTDDFLALFTTSSSLSSSSSSSSTLSSTLSSTSTSLSDININNKNILINNNINNNNNNNININNNDNNNGDRIVDGIDVGSISNFRHNTTNDQNNILSSSTIINFGINSDIDTIGGISKSEIIDSIGSTILQLNDSFINLNFNNNYIFNNNNNFNNNYIIDNNITTIQFNGTYPSGYTLPHIIIASIIVTILMIIIVVGNMLVIIAIATEKSLKNIQNWFIASLAVADFFLGLVIMPFSLANELMGYWIFGDWWCDIHSAMDVLLCTASIMNLCLISLDRYWSITKAVEYLKSRTPMRAAIMITAVWIMSGLICIPPLLGWKVKRPEGQQLPQCALSEDIGYVLYSALGSFYIPSCIMVFVYIRIYFAAKRRARRGIKKQPRKPPSEQVTSFSRSPNKGSVPMPSVPSTSVQKQRQQQIATIETQPTGTTTVTSSTTTTTNSSNMPIPIVTCDFASDISTSEAAEIEAQQMNNKETLQVCNLPTQNSTTTFTSTTIATTTTNNNGSNGCNVITTVLANNELKVSPIPNRARALSVGIDTDMVSEFDPSSSDSGVVSRCAVVKPLKFRLCQPIFGRKNHRRNEAKQAAAKNNNVQNSNKTINTTTEIIIASELEPAIPKLQKPRDPEKEKRRIARKKEKRATLILGLIMGSFIACWLPFFFLYILTPACVNCEIPQSAFAVAFWLGYMNSALNPAIYTIFNKDFRRAFRRILFK